MALRERMPIRIFGALIVARRFLTYFTQISWNKRIATHFVRLLYKVTLYHTFQYSN